MDTPGSAASGSRTHAPGKSAAATQLDRLAWLEGAWRADAGTRTVFETWARSENGTLSGTGATAGAAGGQPEAFESLQVTMVDNEVLYVVTGAGNEQPVTFVLTSAEEQRFRFENPNHDFPRRIDYIWLDEDHCRVEVSDATGPGGRGFALDFHRLPDSVP